ncbi:pancreatic lipase-related protein 2-like [Drosophila busckii]|uniref:pancreatic lipase-related protein 2-like n=1 Tax=Drosophila busckii TaxID=30019 RepID=UPI00083F4D33|nr:pancreatic lipase-related protein 2-like [Drosophila busckii]
MCTVCAMPGDKRINGVNGWYIPQQDWTLKWMDMDEVEAMMQDAAKMEQHARSSNKVSFYLYTSLDPINGRDITPSSDSILCSYFNNSHPTRILIHGWTQDYNDSMNTEITKAWLSLGDYNIIVVDWSHARTWNYLSSVESMPIVAKEIAKMIKALSSEHGMSLSTLHLIGYSLGAHVAGLTGRELGTGRIHTIIGLDPSTILIRPDRHLSAADAYYVESIQTHGNFLGCKEPIGKIAFYPNGGQIQPGCRPWDFECSHGRSWIYYAEALTMRNFRAKKCCSLQHAMDHKCEENYSNVRIGAETNANLASGIYYVPVSDKAPYGSVDL